jgi:hypothetical protein
MPLAAGTYYKVKAGDSLQTILNSVVSGDVVELQAGATFTGNFVLRAQPEGSSITIRSSGASALTASRVSPADASKMAKIVTANGSAAISTDPGANGYLLLGLEVAPATGVYPYSLIYIGSASATSASTQPAGVTIMKCYVHGDPRMGGKNAITLQTRSAMVQGSYISDIKSTIQDSVGIGSYNGPGPFYILNNYVEASGENVFFGGATARIPGVVPSDITIRGNTLYKPLRWRPGSPDYEGTAWIVKNHFELKNGQRVYFDGNILENCWVSGQNGTSILLTVRTENKAMPWAVVQDVYIMNNVIRHVGAGFTGTASDDDGSGFGRRWLIRNNIFEDVDQYKWGGGGAGWGFNLMRNPANVTIDHNTVFASRFAFFMSSIPAQTLTFANNITTAPIAADSFGLNKTMASKVQTTIRGNLFIGMAAADVPPGNASAASAGTILFTDMAASNYNLLPDSPWRGTATDGMSPGATLIPAK